MKYSHALLAVLVAMAVPACGGKYDASQLPAAPAAAKSIAPYYCGLLTYPGGHPVCWPYAAQCPELEAKHFGAINEMRGIRGLPPLEVEPLAIEGARAHAFHQVVHGFSGDQNPEGDNAFTRYLQMGAWYVRLLELSARVDDATQPLASEAIFSETVNHIGIGIWDDPKTGTWTVVYDMIWK